MNLNIVCKVLVRFKAILSIDIMHVGQQNTEEVAKLLCNLFIHDLSWVINSRAQVPGWIQGCCHDMQSEHQEQDMHTKCGELLHYHQRTELLVHIPHLFSQS
jgi:lysozyme family protein